MPKPAQQPTTPNDINDQAQPTEHNNTQQQVEQLTQQISELKTTALNKHLQDNNYAVSTRIMQRLGHDPASIVNADLSINNDKLNTILQSIKDDGFVIEQQDTPLDKLVSAKGLTNPAHIELLRTITDSQQRNNVATVLANEIRNRVNSRVGQGAESSSRFSSLAAGEDLYESRKHEQ